MKKYMGWYGVKDMNLVGRVVCNILTNRMIHTFKGMIFYYLTDTGSAHFEHVMHNISDSDVIDGKTLHAIYDKADLKNCYFD